MGSAYPQNNGFGPSFDCVLLPSDQANGNCSPGNNNPPVQQQGDMFFLCTDASCTTVTGRVNFNHFRNENGNPTETLTVGFMAGPVAVDPATSNIVLDTGGVITISVILEDLVYADGTNLGTGCTPGTSTTPGVANCITDFLITVDTDAQQQQVQAPGVPEPTTIALLGLGLLGAGYTGRKRAR